MEKKSEHWQNVWENIMSKSNEVQLNGFSLDWSNTHKIATISISDLKFLPSIFRQVNFASVYLICKMKDIK